MAGYEGVEGRLGREWISAESLASRVDGMLRASYEAARRYGRIVGRISRFGEVRVEEGARVEFEIDPQVYYSAGGEAPFHRVGDYLAVVDPKTLKVVLVRVSAIVRKDELAQLGVEPPLSSFSSGPDSRGLLTRTTVLGELVVEMDPSSGEVAPASTSLEPQSPVVDPDPQVLERLLDLPERGIPLGSLATVGSLVKDGMITVRLPVNAIFQHILVIGTTGSGKTTLIKNLVASIYSLLPRDSKPVVVAVDMNQDFIQLPLPPQPGRGGSQADELVRRSVYRGVKPPRGVVVVAPITRFDVEAAIESGANSLYSIVEGVARAYYSESIAPLTGGRGPESLVVRRAGGGFVVEARGLPFNLAFIPYTVDTTTLESDVLSGLMPGLTQLARDLLRRLRERVRRRGPLKGYAGPLQALYGALYAYHELLARKAGDLGEDELLDIAGDAMAPWIVMGSGDVLGYKLQHGGSEVLLEEVVGEYLEALREVKPHRGTLEALLRRVGSLLDSGVVDVAIAWDREGRVEVLGEPSWEWIVGEAYRLDSPVVLDLKWSAEKSLSSVEGPRLAAYRMLERLIAWKQRAWASRARTPSVLVVIDEAHQFFPQEKGAQEEKEASRQVAAMIAKMARLGRARGVGILFSTHSPRDLHDIILQLANTKIILRPDKSQVDSLEVPSEVKPHLPRLPDRHMLVLSHVYKEGYIFVRTTTPLTMHYDVSSMGY